MPLDVASTTTCSSVTASVTSVTLLLPNRFRVAFVLYNDSTSAADVKLGNNASATSFTRRMLAGDFWGTPNLGFNYVGNIDAIWDSATGAMRITELSC